MFLNFDKFNYFSRLEKAINDDVLKQERQESKYSSSAYDATQVFGDVKKFWDCLDKQSKNDFKGAENYPKFIAGDLCRFTIIYFEKLAIKIENSFKIEYFGRMSEILSVVILNRVLISNKLNEFLKNLTINPEDSKTINSLISTAIKNSNIIIDQVIKNAVSKYSSRISEMIGNDGDGTTNEKSLKFIQQILGIIQKESKSKEHELLKSELWKIILEIMSRFVDNLPNKPTDFSTNLRKLFEQIKIIFYGPEHHLLKEKIERIDYLLGCYETCTSSLIHRYFIDRHDSDNFNESQYITVKCHFDENKIYLKICGSNEVILETFEKYNHTVKVSIVPEKYFPTYQDSEYMLKENQRIEIEFELTENQRGIRDAIIYFLIERKGYFNKITFIGEAFVSFKSIPEGSDEDDHEMTLKLSKLKNDSK